MSSQRRRRLLRTEHLLLSSYPFGHTIHSVHYEGIRTALHTSHSAVNIFYRLCTFYLPCISNLVALLRPLKGAFIACHV